LALDLSDDKHPHKLLGSPDGIHVIVSKVVQEEGKGVAYQAALLMKELARVDRTRWSAQYGPLRVHLRVSKKSYTIESTGPTAQIMG